MKNKFTILGCGSSLGSPWITNYKAKLKDDPKNMRTRCCAHIQKGDLSILIDTSPDIKQQFLKNNIKSLDAIIYTHEHADQTTGIFEMRPFYWKNNKEIPVYGSARTIKNLTFKELPNNRILVETDSPYLAPVPLRGKPNEPSYIVHTIKFLSKLKEISFDDFCNITTKNFFNLFGKIN